MALIIKKEEILRYQFGRRDSNISSAAGGTSQCDCELPVLLPLYQEAVATATPYYSTSPERVFSDLIKKKRRTESSDLHSSYLEV